MKDLGEIKYCIGLQIEHLQSGILLYQSNYTEKVWIHFSMGKANSLSTLMVVRSLNVQNNLFRPREDNEKTIGPEVPYLSAIEALIYLANYTRSDIAFATNLLARFYSSPIRRYWNRIKHVFCYLRGTTNFGLFYSRESK